MMAAKILVLGTDFQHSITVVRSLAEAGYSVVIGCEAGSRSYVEQSRHVSGVWAYPQGIDQPEDFVARLASAAAARDISLVFPVGEGQLSMLDRARSRIPEGLPVVLPESDTLKTCLEKDRAYQLASDVGVPVPRQVVAHHLEGLRDAAARVGFPCIVKPRESHHPFFGRKALICDSPETLRRLLPEWPEGNEVLIVQSFCRGRRHNCDLLADKGELLEYFEMAVLRTNRHDGTGLSVDLVSVPPTPDLREHCQRILARLRYTGPAMIQFLVDEQSGDAQFLEINPRLDAFCGAARFAGCDMPALAARLYLGRPADDGRRNPGYAVGHRTHWLWGDLVGLRQETRGGRIGWYAALRWAVRIPLSFVRAHSHLTWDLRDPKPTLTLFARLVPGRRRSPSATGSR